MPPDSRHVIRLPPAGRSSYDPHARQVTLNPTATPYQLAHERAHEAQQQHCTRLWRIHTAVPRWLPYLSRVTNLLIEWQARNVALRCLALVGRRDRAAEAEAARCLWSYVLALLLVPTPAEVATAEVTSDATAARIGERRRQQPLTQEPTGLPEMIGAACQTGPNPLLPPRHTGSKSSGMVTPPRR